MHNIRSSYIENDFGKLISQYVIAFQPASLVELGVLDGYSTLHIAKGMERVEKLRHWTPPKLDAYDLFEDYAHKHGNKEEVEKLLEENGVSRFVNLMKGDAYKVHENYPSLTFDDRGEPTIRGIEFLHIDISNTGQTIRDLMNLWHPKLGWRAIVLIEGGSTERDNIEWMKTYNCPSIKKELETNELINLNYVYGTYFKFPSMTMLFKKWYNEAPHVIEEIKKNIAKKKESYE